MLNSKRKTIAISGASDITSLGLSVIDVAERFGKFLAQKNIITLTGATTGFSYWVAKGAHEAGGVVIGFSPAGNATEHKDSFCLPNDVFTSIIYTGFGFSGRSQMMLKSANALFMGPGYVESVNEFLLAVESGVPVGILEGEWKLDEAIRDIIGNKKKDINVVFGSNAEDLVIKILS